jgi:hypothetical protein
MNSSRVLALTAAAAAAMMACSDGFVLGQAPNAAATRATAKLVAHWPMSGDAADAVGSLHGVARNVTFGAGPDGSRRGAAVFNGRDSLIEVADVDLFHVGTHDFSLAVWVKLDSPMRGVFGDILSKFDARRRRGVNFYVAGSSPAYNGMSDTRHVHFGIDDGYLSGWEDCGKPWATNSHVPCLIAYDGQLYCGIADAEDPKDAARVFRWAGEKKWVDCGRLGDDPNHLSVQAMIVHRGKLYAGTGIWAWRRARGLVKGKPPAAPTRVFVYEGGAKWRDLGQVGAGSRVLCMGSFDGELYVGLDAYGEGKCFKYDGARWIDCGSPDGRNLECLLPLGGVLYVATHGNVYRYEGGQKWTSIGNEPFGITQIHSAQVIGGKIHLGTWPQGCVLRHEGGDKWSNIGRLGLPESAERQINEVNDLTVYNGKVYAGVIPKAEAYRYESDGDWTLLSSLASRPDWAVPNSDSWLRLTSLTCFQGKLFASTGSCRGRAMDVDTKGTLGRVYVVQAGQMVSHDRDVGGDWTHLAAVREAEQLRLYVNGELVASCKAPDGRKFDLTNTEPLTIGFGAQSHFSGSMSDLRIYQGVLGGEQIRSVYAARGR